MSEEGNIRTKKIKKNIFITAVAKGISLLISFLYVPLLIHSLDTNRYAVWLTLTSLVTWIYLFDIGLGNGLRNRLSERLAERNYKEGKIYVSTAYCLIFLIVIVLILLSLLIFPFIEWNNILNAAGANINNLTTLVILVFIGFCLYFGFGLINSILFALQRPGLVAILSGTGQMLSFITVYLLVRVYDIHSLLIIGSVISLIPPLILATFSIIFFTKQIPLLKPDIKDFRKDKIRDVFSIGIQFFILSCVTIVLVYSNNLIITHTVGSESVVVYNICYKYMYISVTLFALICTPIWSATTEAYIKKDMLWINKTKRKLISLSFIFALIGVLQLFLSKFVFKLWIGEECPNIPYSTTIYMLLYVTGTNLYASNGYIINGIGKLRIQIICSSIIAILYVPLAYYTSLHWGLNALLLVLALVPWLNFGWSYIQLNKLINNTANGLWNQ